MAAPPARAPLIYLTGASGAGKDTLIDAARKAFAGDEGLVFARRHITRPADGLGEDHVAVDESRFAAMVDAGDFLFHWPGNGLRYGVHRDYRDALAAGRVVVVNGSRAYLDEARRRCPQLRPVLLRVDPEILRERLLARGRESLQAITERLERTHRLQTEMSADAAVIDNSGALEEAVASFCRLLREASPCERLSAD